MPPVQKVKTCKRCRKEARYGIEPKCRACNFPVADQAPNVSLAEEWVTAVEERYQQARAKAERGGSLAGLSKLQELSARTAVVVSTSVGMAFDLFTYANDLYAAYARLVDAGVRAPALPDHDRQRRAVDNLLYGGYGADITFGALSKDGMGLASYGSVHLELDECTISFRTTVLEENSYHFVKRHNIMPDSLFPPGYLALWQDRSKLAVAKLASKIKAAIPESHFSSLLLESKGNRDTDVFLEAHIYGTFNFQAVRGVRFSPPSYPPDMEDEMIQVLETQANWLRWKLTRLSVEWSNV